MKTPSTTEGGTPQSTTGDNKEEKYSYRVGIRQVPNLALTLTHWFLS